MALDMANAWQDSEHGTKYRFLKKCSNEDHTVWERYAPPRLFHQSKESCAIPSTNRNMQSQQEFSFSNLRAPDWQCVWSIPTTHGETLPALPPNKNSRRQDSHDPDRNDRGADCMGNFVDDDVWIVLRACEDFCSMSQESGADTMQTAAIIDFEPSRLMRLNASSPRPRPKTFFRTFWVSLTRRLMQKMCEEGQSCSL
jgi:hypothetical protein